MSSPARPTKFRDKWRIRWVDETGKRRSAVFATFRDAAYELRLRQAEVEEVHRGTRAPTPVDRTMGQLFDHWMEHRASQKRSSKHDESIIRAHLRPAFADVVLREFSLENVHRFVADPRRTKLDPKTVSNMYPTPTACRRDATAISHAHGCSRTRPMAPVPPTTRGARPSAV